MEWATIERTVEDKKSFLLYVAPGKFLVVPKRVYSSGQIEELQMLLQGKVDVRHENRLRTLNDFER